MKKILTSLLLSALLLGPSTTAFAQEQVSIGVVGEEYEQVWLYVAEKAAEEDIELDVILLTDFNIPNISLADGTLDLNAFQHDVFLENWNKENDGDLVTIGYTVAVPTRIYSEKYDSLDDLPDGAKIAVNNAPTSLSYNLQTLEKAGLISLGDTGELLPTPDDVVDNPKNIEFIEVDAANIPAIVPDVDAAFIDNSFLGATNFQPSDAIYVFGDTAETINIARVNNIAARAEDADNETYLKIVELYQQEDVAEVIKDVTNGGSIPAWDIVREAQEKAAEDAE
ncbi:methionine-binding protein [Aerococcaceae bacterium DSM 109653]|uniref:Methionine-binding protein n=1 Tax=Fundicoccus ignavus TaxID=2664442 RepID=A0A6I2GF65_9LACT|nr:MetQ/NlpA family ABC transporter substrate-binding protein [Fundicoccus ignavus]MRI82251.1 methionine-binding protein [Fundicoccus ignavus]MRI84502.1 methionine-binding protein [Fundicoccus ignavus]